MLMLLSRQVSVIYCSLEQFQKANGNRVESFGLYYLLQRLLDQYIRPYRVAFLGCATNLRK